MSSQQTGFIATAIGIVTVLATVNPSAAAVALTALTASLADLAASRAAIAKSRTALTASRDALAKSRAAIAALANVRAPAVLDAVDLPRKRVRFLDDTHNRVEATVRVEQESVPDAHLASARETVRTLPGAVSGFVAVPVDETRHPASTAELQFYQNLGTGPNGYVRLATPLGKKDPKYALKLMKPIDSAPGEVLQTDPMENERRMLDFRQRNCQHEDAQFITESYSTFRHNGYDCTLMEYCNYGSFDHILNVSLANGQITATHRPVPVEVLPCVVVQILRGLRLLHSSGIIHRDVRPTNILVHETGSVKVSGFGLARPVSDEMMSFVGHSRYMAPEVDGLMYSLAADIYALGITVAALALGFYPIANSENVLLAELQRHRGVTIEWDDRFPPLPDGTEPGPNDLLRGFVQQCIQLNPSNRPTIPQLLNHPFVSLFSTLETDALRRPVADWLVAQDTLPKISKLADKHVKDLRPKPPA